MGGGSPNTTGGAPGFDVEKLRRGIEAKDAAAVSGFYASDARLTFVDRRQRPSQPFQIAGKAAIGRFIADSYATDAAHEVDQIVVSHDGSRAAYLEQFRDPSGRRTFTMAMLDLRGGKIISHMSLRTWNEPHREDATTEQAQAAAEQVEHLDFAEPDEVYRWPHGKAELLNLGGATVGRLTLEPGWRWLLDRKPPEGLERCEATHFMYHLSGALRFYMADGTRFDTQPGDVTLIPPGHGSRALGSEPAVMVDWQGAVDYSGELAEVPRRMLDLMI